MIKIYIAKWKRIHSIFLRRNKSVKTINEDATENALRLAGAWSDIDWDEMERELYRIRHANKPTPLTSTTW